MDDVPAGPASQKPRRSALSVVVPVRNGGSDFERCLRRLHDSNWTDFELIVVDDGSTDDSGAIAHRMGAVVARHERSLGPAAARNLGAQLATAPLIFFLDADVAVYPETLSRGMDRFMADPLLTALFGSYDDQPPAPGLVSQFRNLLHHFVHQQGVFHQESRPAHTFWTGCGMIRREVFLDFGGFDPRLYPRPAIEDIELGYRLARTGHKIILARDVLATHMKRWSLAEVVRTDIFRRGVPWMLLIKRSGRLETDLNVSPIQRICVAITGLTMLAMVALPWNQWGSGGRRPRRRRDRLVESRFLQVSGKSTRLHFRPGRPADAPAVLYLLRPVGRDRPGSVVRSGLDCSTGSGVGGHSAERAGRSCSRDDSPSFPGTSCREAGTMESSIKVAVVRGDRRRGAVAEALALVADDLRRCIAIDDAPVLIPDLDHPGRPWNCSHRDTLSATTDAVLAAGARVVQLVGPAGQTGETPGDPFADLGYRSELWGRPVQFSPEQNAPESGKSAPGVDPRGEPFAQEIPSVVSASRCRISLSVAKTHEIYRVGLGLANLDRLSHRAGSGWHGRGIDTGRWLPWWDEAAAIMHSGRGWLVRAWMAIRSAGGGMRLTAPERRRLEGIERATSSLVARASFLIPQISVIDGFDTMEGEGPRHGRRRNMGTVVAGTDAVAVDAVAASLMGFDPAEIAYLRGAQALGLGVANLSAITVVGDPLTQVRQRVRRHSRDPLLRLAGSTSPKQAATPRPHFGSIPTASPRRTGIEEKRDAHRR